MLVDCSIGVYLYDHPIRVTILLGYVSDFSAPPKSCLGKEEGLYFIKHPAKARPLVLNIRPPLSVPSPASSANAI